MGVAVSHAISFRQLWMSFKTYFRLHVLVEHPDLKLVHISKIGLVLW
jgi:hypothetical protein